MAGDFESKFFKEAVPASAAPLLAALAGGDAPAPRFRRYDLQERLGEGGMAVVYRATDRDLNRDVAIKVIKEELSDASGLRIRFEREKQAGAKLQHPNIVTLLDAGDEGGRGYIVMELVRGHPLNLILDGRRTDQRALITILEKTARAVHYAHENGVIHRDLKPGNIIVTEAGEPKVADFGLALLQDSNSDLTRTGAAIGTPSYMAPEQVRGGGKSATARTDVYSLGAILYEILTGRPPHTAESMMQLLRLVESEDPVAPRRISGRIAPDLENVCLKALEKDPSRRYASAAALADDLARYLRGEPVAAKAAGWVTRSVRWSRRHRAVSAGVLAGLVGFAAVVAAVLLTLHRAAEERRAEVARHLSDGRRFEAERRGIERELSDARTLRRAVAGAVDPMAPAAEKKGLWDADERVEALSLRLADLKASSVTAFARAVGVDPACDEARRALSLHYWSEFEKAEAEGDLAAAAGAKQYVLLYDASGAYRARFDAPGTLSIASVPAGAEIHLYRFVKAADRTLAPTPVNAASGELAKAAGLATSDFNRVDGEPGRRWTLPSGSYLALLERSGCVPVRCPILVRRGAACDVRVNLYATEDVGEGYVQISAGPFIRGGDPGASSSPPLDPAAETGDFFIALREARMDDYIDFLNDLNEQKGSDEVRRRQPRMSVRGDTFLKLPPEGEFGVIPQRPEPAPGLPVFGISWDDATAFAEWMTRRSAAGDRKRTYRLPTIVEWEKAARGVDGRFYPWGNTFDWSYMTRAVGTGSIPGGTYRDESPYGVLDLAGSLREWCQDAYDEARGLRHIRGGGMLMGEGFYFRAANEAFGDGRIPFGSNGIRIVMIPSKPR